MFRRILKNPRIVIYLLAIISCCIYLPMMSRKQKKQAAPVPSTTIRLTPSEQRANPSGGKEATISHGVALPRLYLFGTEKELRSLDSLKQTLAGRCQVMFLIGVGDSMKNYFRLESLPIAILYSADNEELARYAAPLSSNDLKRAVEMKIEQK